MKKFLNAGFLAAAGCLIASQAWALGVNTNTSVRCFYKVNNQSTDPSSDYVWARSAGAGNYAYYKLSGNWYQDGITSLDNMYYTTVAQSTLKSLCQESLTKMGVSQPVMMMAAANTAASLNYTIWTIDSVFQATKINKVVVFGDSVSDTGNLYNATGWVVPNKNSYFRGHFTNAKVWDEYLTDALSLPNYNWAVAGAAADDYYVVPGVPSQASSFLKYMAATPNYKPANTLVTMLIGGNDLISYNRTVDSIIANEQQALENLITNGGIRNILLLNVPDLSKAPRFKYLSDGAAQSATVAAEVNDLNARLVQLRSTLASKYASLGLNIKLYDTRTKVDDLFYNPGKYGITNTTDSCLQLDDVSTANYAKNVPVRAICTNADAFVFWDQLHPTTRAHKAIADDVTTFVKANFPVN